MLLFFLMAITVVGNEHVQPLSKMHGFSWSNFAPGNGTFAGRYCEVHHCDLRHPRRANSTAWGHLQAMGAQVKVPRRVEEVDADDLQPADFYANFVAKAVPVLVRGAARRWPAYAKWGNVSYLQEHCQHEDGSEWPADVEVHKQVVQNDRGPTQEGWTFCKYLQSRLEPEFADKLYVSTPFKHQRLRRDLRLLPHLRDCNDTQGRRMRDVFDHMNLWMSTGNTSSSLHFDTIENTHVMLNGSKTFQLWSPMASLEM